MAPRTVHLLPLVREGILSLLRVRAVPLLLLGGLAMSIVAFMAPIPLRERGMFALGAVALVDQLLVTLLVAAHLLATRSTYPAPWWPTGPGIALIARGLGMASATALLAGALVLAQYLLAMAFDDLEARDVLRADLKRIDSRYLHLWGSLAAFGLVLTAWGQAVRSLLGPALSLLAILALVFSAFFLPRLLDEHEALRPLFALIPDLASVSPQDHAEARRGFDLKLILYLLTHVGAVWALAACAVSIRHARGGRIDFDRGSQ